MDWECAERAQSFEEFKRVADMWFNIKGTKKEDQHNCIILWTGREGLKMFNTWGITEEHLKDQKHLGQVQRMVPTP